MSYNELKVLRLLLINLYISAIDQSLVNDWDRETPRICFKSEGVLSFCPQLQSVTTFWRPQAAVCLSVYMSLSLCLTFANLLIYAVVEA